MAHAHPAGDKTREVRTEKGTENLTPAEFEKRYGWRNDPAKVFLTPP